jgi:DNA replication protein DnaD
VNVLSEQSYLVVYNGITDTIDLPRFIIKNLNKIGIKSNEFQLFSLIYCLEAEGEFHPSQETLAEMMGLSERQLKQIISSLKGKGLLEVKRAKSKTTYNFKPMIDKAYNIQHQLTS